MKLLLITLITLLIISFGFIARTTPSLTSPYTALPGYNIDITQTTISGISSGGAFVQQLGFAYSSIIKGVATIAGIPYGCASGQISIALSQCMNVPSGINVQTLITQTKKLETSGQIDPLTNIKNQQQYFYSGKLDTVVRPGVVEKAAEMVSQYGVEPIKEFSILSEHTWPTLNQGNPCSQLGAPYISKCNYQSSNVFMKQFLGAAYKDPVTQVSSNLVTFDQGEYVKAGSSLGNKGYIYVPAKCSQGSQCRLHIAFHGCGMTLADIGNKFATWTGLNELAESNNLVVLYPQVQKSTLNPQNPNGCWDWWGYTTTLIKPLEYLTKNAPQINAVYRMAVDLSKKSEK